MTVTPHTPRKAPPADKGSSAGFVLVALGAVLASLGVMQLEVQGGPWPAPMQQPTGLRSSLQAPRLLPDTRQARALRRDASSEAAPAGGLYRNGDASGQ